MRSTDRADVQCPPDSLHVLSVSSVIMVTELSAPSCGAGRVFRTLKACEWRHSIEAASEMKVMPLRFSEKEIGSLLVRALLL